MSARAMQFDRPLPQNLDAERALLGAVLVNNVRGFDALCKVDRRDFSLAQHRLIYDAMVHLLTAGQPVDSITLTEVLAKRNRLDDAGGVGYISALGDGIPTMLNLEPYGAVVTEKARRRRLANVAGVIFESALDESGEFDPFERSIGELLAAAGGQNELATIRTWNQVANDALDVLYREKTDPQSRMRWTSGIADLDEMTSGLRRREIVVLTGPTSNGKSLLTLQYAVSGDAAGYRGMIFSGEMSGESILLRELAFEAGVPFWFTRRPEQMQDGALELLRGAAKRQRNLLIVDRNITPARIWALMEMQKRTKGLDFVIVDYDQLVISAGIAASDDESFFRHQGEFMNHALEAAKRLDICFMLVAQLRKAPPQVLQGVRKPNVDDIFGHSAIRNHPHFILWVQRLYFPDMKKENERKALCYVVKARNDKTGRVDLDFDPDFVRFKDAPPSEADSTRDRAPQPPPQQQLELRGANVVDFKSRAAEKEPPANE